MRLALTCFVQKGPRLSEIDRLRNSPGQMYIGEQLSGAITGSYLLVDQLLIIRNDSVYSVRMADQIDPNRTNADIPNVSQLIFDLGSDSDAIRRSLLTAGELFRTPYLSPAIDATRARGIAFDSILHILTAIKAGDLIAADVDTASAATPQVVDRAVQLPSIGGLWPRFAAFLQAVEHAFQEMYQLALIFVPDASSKGQFIEGFRDAVREQVGEDTSYFRFAAAFAENGVFIRNVRHCIEHESEKQKVIISDFGLDLSGAIQRPRIEIIHRNTPQAETDLAIFCADLAKITLDGFESLVAHLASSNTNCALPIPTWVGRAPEKQITPDRSDICYLVKLGNDIVRLG